MVSHGPNNGQGQHRAISSFQTGVLFCCAIAMEELRAAWLWGVLKTCQRVQGSHKCLRLRKCCTRFRFIRSSSLTTRTSRPPHQHLNSALGSQVALHYVLQTLRGVDVHEQSRGFAHDLRIGVHRL